jgi:hypothetical protein
MIFDSQHMAVWHAAAGNNADVQDFLFHNFQLLYLLDPQAKLPDHNYFIH